MSIAFGGGEGYVSNSEAAEPGATLVKPLAGKGFVGIVRSLLEETK